MYDTLIMLKPDASFTPDGLYELVAGVVTSNEAQLSREGKGVRIAIGDSWIEIAWNPSGYVRVESDEIADRFSIPCRGCHRRFEMTGDDPTMDLFNDYLLINERLQATNDFVIFDSQECKLMFEPEQ